MLEVIHLLMVKVPVEAQEILSPDAFISFFTETSHEFSKMICPAGLHCLSIVHNSIVLEPSLVLEPSNLKIPEPVKTKLGYRPYTPLLKIPLVSF